MKNVPDPLNRSRYCGDPGALVSYLYNDGTPEELAAIATHVQTCEACTIELASLGDTRELLSAWSPPPTELGLTLSASDALPIASTLPPPATAAAMVTADALPWWRQSTPVWMQAVAATMVFAAGMAIGAGRGMAPEATSVNATPAAPGQAPEVQATSGVSRSELAALEARLRGELARLTPATAAQPSAVQAASRPDDALVKRFQALLNESEERQRGELALRIAQVLRDTEIQRKLDIATLQNDISKIQGVTGQELLRQRELTNQLINRVGLPGGAR
jgi:hypothetical protein